MMTSGENVVAAKSVAKRIGILESNVIMGGLPHERVKTQIALLTYRTCGILSGK